VRDAGLELSGYCRGGMFTSDAAHAASARRQPPLRRRGQGAGRACIVLVVGGLPQYSRPGSAPQRTSRARGAGRRRHRRDAGLREQASMPLAIEPLHPAYAADRACVNTTSRRSISATPRSTRSGMLGVALDVYHIWWDPS
jgi:hypothetical protein